jgi:peptidoglycan/xylan/chitin deacetylase (PgdA/CDA1 family)
MSLVGWQVRVFDTQIRESKSIAEKVLGKIQPGGIILLHDGSDSESGGDRTPTLGALPMIIQGLKDRGMEFFTLDRLLGMSKEAQGMRPKE